MRTPDLTLAHIASPLASRTSSPRGTRLVIVAAAVLVGLAAVTSIAVPIAARLVPSAAVVATVNLETVLSNLDERVKVEGELMAYKDTLEGELKKLGTELGEMQSKLRVMSEGPDKKAAAVKFVETQLQAKAKQQVSEALIDQKRAETFRDLYLKISAAAQKMAEKNGYTMVISTDVHVKLPEGPSNDIERTISLKRFLYVAKDHDISAELAQLMNNEYKAGVK